MQEITKREREREIEWFIFVFEWRRRSMGEREGSGSHDGVIIRYVCLNEVGEKGEVKKETLYSLPYHSKTIRESPTYPP